MAYDTVKWNGQHIYDVYIKRNMAIVYIFSCVIMNKVYIHICPENGWMDCCEAITYLRHSHYVYLLHILFRYDFLYNLAHHINLMLLSQINLCSSSTCQFSVSQTVVPFSFNYVYIVVNGSRNVIVMMMLRMFVQFSAKCSCILCFLLLRIAAKWV